MGVSKNRGTPKSMVYNGNPIKMDDLGVPPFQETPIFTLQETIFKSAFLGDTLVPRRVHNSVVMFRKVK